MSADARPEDAFAAAKDRLVERMRACVVAVAAQSRSPLSRELEDIEEALTQLADRIEFGAAWTEIDDAGDQWGGSFTKHTIGRMRILAEATGGASQLLPNPRARPWRDDAATAYLHLRYRNGATRPKLSNNHPAVIEFGQMLEAAGSPRAPETVRGMLSRALRDFDPFMQAAGFEDLF